MKRYLVTLLFCGSVGVAAAQSGAGTQQAGAATQSILHTKWWTYYLPITDTITASFSGDSMAVTTSTGAALLKSTFKVDKAVITLHDYGGENMCADLAGTYHVRITADTLILVMDEDPCDARGNTLIAKRWIRVPAPPSAAPAAAKKRRKG